MDLLEERKSFEARLGHFIAQHPIALSCARKMIKKARWYLTLRSAKFGGGTEARNFELTSLLKKCCLPLTDQYTGRVGDSLKQLNRVFRGQANLRELMAHNWAFGNKLLCSDLVGKNRLPEALPLAAEAGLNVIALEEMIQAALAFKGVCSLDQLDPKEDFMKMPWHPIRQEQEAMRLKSSLQENDSLWSTQTRCQFEAEGGVFSEMEQQLSSGLGAAYVPWLDAQKMWSLDEAHPVVKEARQAQIPLVTGLSGMTMQFMQLARILNVGPMSHVRLASLGYLLSTKSHSFHEVMIAAAPFGCVYKGECDYGNLAPLSVEEIVAACGPLPGFLIPATAESLVWNLQKER